MANSTRKGNGAERAAWRSLEADGYLVASRRHIGGAGDLVAVPKDDHIEQHPLLIEVKETGAGAYAHFGPEDREALLATAVAHRMVPVLMWRAKPSASWRLLYASDWPKSRDPENR